MENEQIRIAVCPICGRKYIIKDPHQKYCHIEPGLPGREWCHKKAKKRNNRRSYQKKKWENQK